MRRRRWLVPVAAGLCLSGLVATGPAAATPSPVAAASWRPVVPPLPPVPVDPGESVASVACAPGSTGPAPCTAVGQYLDGSGRYRPLALAERSDARWQATELPLPAAVRSLGFVTVSSVSCPAAGACVAVGVASAAAGSDGFGLVFTETAGTWSSAAAPPPPGAGPSSYTELTEVACAAAGSCTAIAATRRSTSAAVLVEADGRWRSLPVPLPTDPPAATPSSSPVLASLACVSQTCVAVGSYVDDNDVAEPLVVTGSGGSWTAASVAVPSAATSAGLVAVSCPASGDCVAVGGFSTELVPAAGLLATESPAGWTSAIAPIPPSLGPAEPNEVVAVACVAVGTCRAVSDDETPAGAVGSTVLNDAGGTWSAATAPLPPGAGAGSQQVLASVACGGGLCAAAGSLRTKAGDEDGVVDVASTGGFVAHLVAVGATAGARAARAGAGPATHAAFERPLAPALADALLSSVACEAGDCVAGGGDVAPDGDQSGLLVGVQPAGLAVAQPALPAGGGYRDAVGEAISLACPAPGRCVAVGGALDEQDDVFRGPLVETLVGGRWSPEVLRLPGGARPELVDALESAACASPGNCVAVGSYEDAAGATLGLVASERAGRWTTATAPLPPGAGADPAAYLQDVTFAHGRYTIVGEYGDTAVGAPAGRPVVWTGSPGHLAVSALPLPLSALAPAAAVVYSVACPAPGACLAGGYYLDGAGDQVALVEAERAGSWHGAAAPLPGDAEAWGSAVDDVACLRAGDCVAAGDYLDEAGVTEGLLDGERSGAYVAGSTPLPRRLGGRAVDVEGLSCGSSACAVVGGFGRPGRNEFALLDVGAGTRWRAVAVPVRSGPHLGALGELAAVSCLGADACGAVGSYRTTHGAVEGLVLRGAGPSWAASRAPLPGGAAADPDTTLYQVVCPTLASCAASGTYATRDRLLQFVLETPPTRG